MPRRPPSLRHRAVIGRRRLLGEIRHLQAAEKLLVRTLRALAVEGAALQAIVAAESSGTDAPAVGRTISASLDGAPLRASLLGLGDVLVANAGERAAGSAPATETVEVGTAASSLAASGAGAGSIADGSSAAVGPAGDSGATGPGTSVGQVEFANLGNAFALDEDDDDFDF